MVCCEKWLKIKENEICYLCIKKCNIIENKVFDCYSPGAETKTQTIINEIRSKTKDQAPNIVLNLEDYEGSVDELIELIKRKATPEGDLKRLEELRIIKDGEIIDILG